MYETGIIHNQGGGVITAKSSQKDYLTGGGLSFQNLRFNKNVLYILLFSVLEKFKCENDKCSSLNGYGKLLDLKLQGFPFKISIST